MPHTTCCADAATCMALRVSCVLCFMSRSAVKMLASENGLTYLSQISSFFLQLAAHLCKQSGAKYLYIMLVLIAKGYTTFINIIFLVPLVRDPKNIILILCSFRLAQTSRLFEIRQTTEVVLIYLL